MFCCRLDAARKNTETAANVENDRKASRHRSRILSTSSDEDDNESSDQQVSTWHALFSVIVGIIIFQYHAAAS